ncbi:MAG: hypothetical protein OXC46_05365 [Thaumarchaeota archaeon]|nr:hypothetical protein [Nitrososphaerota archaeon]
MSNQLLDKIEYKVKNIDTDDRVDVDELTQLKDKLLKIEKKWLKIDHENSYSFYYGVRSVILVLEKIIERYQTEREDASQIGKDMLEAIPYIQDIIQDAEYYKTHDDLAKHILEKTDQLDEIACNVNLLKSDEEYLEGVDKKSILKLSDGISYHYRCKDENMSGGQVVIKILPSSNQQPKIHQKEINMIHEFYNLRQLVNEHEKKWLTVETLESFNFGAAISVAGSLLDNTEANIENTHFSIKCICNVIKLVVLPKQENQALRKPESFIQVFPKLSNLTKNILHITKDTSITEERKNRVVDNMMALIDFTYDMDLVDFTKYKPPADPDVAIRQHDDMMESLEANT